MSSMNIGNIKLALNAVEIVAAISRTLSAGLVPMIHGSPGIGKSEVVAQVAEKFNLKLIDVRLSQCDPTDLNGFPSVDPVTGRSSYFPMDTFPLEGDEIPKGYDGWLVFLDEMPSASRAVQAAAYKLLLDRMIGQRKLHKNVAMVGAGNLETDNAIVEEMSTALQSRLVHLEMRVDHKVWLDHAMARGVDHRITSFIQFKPDSLMNFDPDHTDRTYGCPRTWFFSDRLTRGQEKVSHDDLPLLAGTIGQGLAREFVGFCQIHGDLPSLQTILSNPSAVPMPEEPSVLYALTGAVANHATPTNIGTLMGFISRMTPEFQVICLREVVRRDTTMLQNAAVSEWISRNATELF